MSHIKQNITDITILEQNQYINKNIRYSNFRESTRNKQSH